MRPSYPRRAAKRTAKWERNGEFPPGSTPCAPDGPWPETRVRLYWRFLETFDEYFPYSEKEFPPQGFWQIYGLGLPDNVLKSVYHENALRIIPGLKAKFTAFVANRDE